MAKNGFQYLLAVLNMIPFDGKASTKLVLITIVQHRNSKTYLCCPSIDRLVSLTGLNKRTVLRALQALKRVGILKWVRGYGHGVANHYTIDLRAVEQYRDMTAKEVAETLKPKPKVAKALEAASTPAGEPDGNSSGDTYTPLLEPISA